VQRGGGEPRRPHELADVGAREVLDVGCGGGAVSLAAADALGGDTRIVAVDVSAPLVAAARERVARRGAPVEVVLGDAATHPFPAGRFDAVTSRFGVMFFDDPTAAFAHLRAACRPGAALRVLTWRAPEENPFMTAAGRATERWLPGAGRPSTDAPGQFGLADRDRFAAILAAAGWGGVELVPVDVPCTLPAHRLPEDVERLGPLGAALDAVDPAQRDAVLAAARAAMAPFVHGDEARFDAACWLARAVAPAA
jgi:SAM-dependent methyltransferase